MTDDGIIRLYWQRSDQAIAETDAVYGGYCYSVAYRVLNSDQDAEESVNDTYLAVWNAIPPTWPENLKAFLGQITRRLAVTRLRRATRLKRGGGEAVFAIEELAECTPDGFDVEGKVEAKELAKAIEKFLDSLPERERHMFVARYWHVLPVSEIACRLGMKQGAVKTALHRQRKKLMEELKKEGLV